MDTIRVLLVDDSPFMLEMLKAALNIPGIEVCGTANNGQSAIDIYPILKPNLVTMDITMPDMDGLICSENILGIDDQARIIIISSMLDEALQKRGQAIGVKAFIQKPVNPDDLLFAIRSLFADQSESLSLEYYARNLSFALQKNLMLMANLNSSIDMAPTKKFRLDSSGIAIIIGITGSKKGKATLDLSPVTAKAIATKIFGHEQLSEDAVINAITEYFNISCGHCNSNINNSFQDIELRLTPPSVAIGDDMNLPKLVELEYEIIITTDSGTMKVNLELSGDGENGC
ncbi:MAG: response regulator [Syntrophomonadaceae bacterium]|jgi:DNA-binding NarL/FixJ family response regulator